LGLGSAALGTWLKQNRPLFLGLTLAFLAVAFYSANKDRKKGGKKGMLMFYVASVLSFAFVVYSEFFK